MTRLVRVPLGTAPGHGKQAVDQCAALKRQLRSVLATPPGAALLTVADQGAMSVEAVYDAHTPGSEGWAKRTEALAPQIWETLADRRAVRVR